MKTNEEEKAIVEEAEAPIDLIKQNSKYIGYVRSVTGNSVQTFRSLIENQNHREIYEIVKNLNLKFTDSKCITLLKISRQTFLEYVSTIGDIVLVHDHFCMVLNNDMIFMFSIEIETLSETYITIYSDSIEKSRRAIEFIKEKLKHISSSELVSMELHWYYFSKGIVDNTYVTEELNDVFFNEAYPYLDIETFIDEYLESEEPILVLVGPPGTGKTRLIREILRKRHKKNGIVSVAFTSDQNVIENSEMFVSFILSKLDTLVIEDIDYHLRPRKDGNAAMYNFLTSSNGIVVNHIKKKKMIFSTNLPDIKNIDEALLRPGRCFKVVETRALNRDEALKLSAKINNYDPLPSKSYTIAEIFNSKPKKETKSGFIS